MVDFKTKIEINQGINEATLDRSFKYIKGFTLLNFQDLDEYHFESKDCEIGILILKGTCDISINKKDYKNLGKRKDVFSDIPTGIYIPIDSSFSIKAKKATVAICRAKCSARSEPTVIYPEDVKIVDIGRNNCYRRARFVIGPDCGSINLIVGETINFPGNWSAVPPARHEKDNLPEESLHEEMFYFKTDKPKGWGIERIYSPQRYIDELIYLEDNTVTFMPWGYHEIVAAPGYTLYYLFFLAGEGNKLVQLEDPDHKWIKEV